MPWPAKNSWLLPRRFMPSRTAINASLPAEGVAESNKSSWASFPLKSASMIPAFAYAISSRQIRASAACAA
nr:hypothetical protein [Escherichia coli]